MTGAQHAAALFAEVGDDEIGHAVWARVEERIGGASISDWLRARGHGWTLSARPPAFAEVRPIKGGTRLHHGDTINIRIKHDGSRRGEFLALYRCLDAAVTSLADIAAGEPATDLAGRQLEMAVGS